ncbi:MULTISPECIES: GNAT family N-acetyltransferase [Mesotoga]|jgi:predicted acetyltransferase|uniref:Putative acetyltransferase n=2 Tax=Mesotoga TaxID=1184396 RepID=I2F808_9BACT|nr:GNAT family N-acetyltransferase [Mesotoga prima]CCU85081.1 GCN5-related N-acetyltransferase [Mesotoga infera]AFK08061.1 putative acetyltransferase [Mesotoga prima MesG1.Ag.4.2]HNQ71572.1 GNAT family N-acetyltransferase [Mesotoga prima]HNS76613.1 GNAT family N-acetyltransferase [Mesotoga prima]HPA00569.1 GNAT family N-acetyltransferase [Mesotoga prima]
MEIRRIDSSYKDKIVEIFLMSFEYFEPEESEFFFSDPSLWKYVWGAFDDEKLVAAYISYKYLAKIRTKPFECRYVEAVATLPEYRNKGITKAILLKDIQEALQSGVNFLMLDPFKHDFYVRFGFGLGFESLDFKFDFSLLSDEIEEDNLNIVSGKLLNSAEMQELIEKARKVLWETSRYTEAIEINACSQEIFHMKDLFGAVAVDKAGMPHAMMVYRKKERKMKVSNFSFIDLAGLFALKRFMLNHRDQIATFEMNRMPPDFPVELFFHSRWQAGKDLKIEDASSRMVRILDPLPVIKELMNRSISETVVIKIKDKLLPQNNLTIEIGKGTARLSEAPNDLEITISDLTPLLTGRLSPTRLWRHGRLRTDSWKNVPWGISEVPEKVKVLESIFPPFITHNAN